MIIPKNMLSQLYRESDAAYTGIDNLYREAKKRGLRLTRKDIQQYLRGVSAYTIHFQGRKTFPRRRVVATAIDSDWQADLADLKEVSRNNRGFRYLLTVIDVLSKFSWAAPLKTKRSTVVSTAFSSILNHSGRCPMRLFTDQGVRI